MQPIPVMCGAPEFLCGATLEQSMLMAGLVLRRNGKSLRRNALDFLCQLGSSTINAL